MKNMDNAQAIRKTRSVCPVCLKPLEAALTVRDGVVFQEKTCTEHGEFSVPVWHGKVDMELWRSSVPSLTTSDGLSCPSNCGICAEHQSETCCALIEVTRRCNLDCRFCFAHGGESDEEPPLAELLENVRRIAELGNNPLLQFSGGEPTLRDDLPALVAWAKACGVPYVQLNTNGLRLAHDEAYVRDLSAAGLSFVFLQFDGVNDDVFRTLRNAPLLDEKTRAIEMCGKYGLGVTLVPTVVRGVNDKQLGDIVRFAASHSPIVRGVHFQPVSFFGRVSDVSNDRYTLDELITDLCEQAELPMNCIVPSHCDHPMCGMHSSFVVQPDASLLPLSSFAEQEVKKTTAVQNREYVARHWLRSAELMENNCCCGAEQSVPEPTAVNKNASGTVDMENICCCGELEQPVPEPTVINKNTSEIMDMDDFLRTVQERSLTLTSMAFMDAANFDVERLRHCSLHVWKNGMLMPFCAAYLSPIQE